MSRAKNWRPSSVSTNLGSSGPSRVDTSTPDPEFKPRPVGFTAHIESAEADSRDEEES